MKKWMLLAMICLMAVIVAACGPSKEKPSTEPSNEQQDTNKQDTQSVGEESDQATDTDIKGNENENDPYERDILVDLKNNEGQSVGVAMLSQQKDGVLIKLDASELPSGMHGFHFHENGACEAPDFKSAGDHFNPEDKEHGLENEKGSHAGDLPNIKVGENGVVDEEIVAKGVTLELDKPNSLLKEGGTAIIIHENEDDGTSQPAGDAGDRMVCGIVE